MSTPIDVRDRLQPALLDRLTDDSRLGGADPEDRRVMSKAQMRAAVLRDLAWLFNAVQPLGSEAERHPRLAGSVLNFGLPPLAGRLASKLDVSELEKIIRDTIVHFEPRILAATLEVHAVEADSVLDTHNIIEFEISGQLWAQPVSLEILLRTQVDLEAGQVEVREATGRPGRAAGRGHSVDPRLLRLYTDELNHLQEVGQEFAQAFPQVASRLGMESLPVADPYVERLLEGFAFLAARVQLKLEAEQPRLIAQLLEALYPNFLVPVPSMMVVRLGIDALDPNLMQGYRFPRGSVLRSEHKRGQDTQCEFCTAHEVVLWPTELVAAGYFSHAPDLPLSRLGAARGVKGGLRIRLRSGGGVPFAQLGLDKLAFYIAAPDDVAFRLHELVLGSTLGSLVGDDPQQWRGEESVQPLGVAADEALLPESLRAFSGHRLMQEVAALPQRLLFFEVGGLAERLARVQRDEVELVLLFGRGDPGLEPLVDAKSLALFCTPAINLFAKRLDRIQIGPGAWDYHVVPDRARPMDYEVHSLQTVTGHGGGSLGPQAFLPLYAAIQDTSQHPPGYYTVRREPRLLSAGQQKQGARSSYVGEEVYVALVDPAHAPHRADIRQLSVTALVSNRDLPTLLPQGPANGTAAAPAWKPLSPGPVQRVDCLRGPTRPVSRRPVGELGWRLVNHLALNHLSLIEESPERAAAVLRTTLALYGPPEDGAWQRQLDGLRALRAKAVVRRLPFKGPLSFGTGIEFELELDELAYQGSSAFLFASLLEVFLARHAAINTFTQTRLVTPQRGEVKRWPVRIGSRELV